MDWSGVFVLQRKAARRLHCVQRVFHQPNQDTGPVPRSAAKGWKSGRGHIAIDERATIRSGRKSEKANDDGWIKRNKSHVGSIGTEHLAQWVILGNPDEESAVAFKFEFPIYVRPEAAQGRSLSFANFIDGRGSAAVPILRARSANQFPQLYTGAFFMPPYILLMMVL